MKIFKILYTVIAVIVFVFLSSCTSEDMLDTGNTSDIAVTGNVIEVYSTYASIYGYSNPSQLPKNVTNAAMSIQVSSDPTMKDAKKSTFMTPLNFGKSASENTVSNMIFNLGPNKTYYYRTLVYANNDEYYYGEIKSFKTKGMVNVVTSCNVKDITNKNCIFVLQVDPNNFPDFDRDDADVEDASVGVFYSLNQSHLSDIESIRSNVEGADRDVFYKEDLVSYSTTYSRKDVIAHYEWPTRLASNSFLESGTTYYYRTYTQVNGSFALGDIASFTTQK